MTKKKLFIRLRSWRASTVTNVEVAHPRSNGGFDKVCAEALSKPTRAESELCGAHIKSFDGNSTERERNTKRNGLF